MGTLKNKTCSTAPPETSDSTVARPKHPNTDEAEENDIKNNFMKMIETLKEEMKNSLKEMEEKTNKKLEDISKSLKGSQENQEKTVKQFKQFKT